MWVGVSEEDSVANFMVKKSGPKPALSRNVYEELKNILVAFCK